MSGMSRLATEIEFERNDLKLILDDNWSDAVDDACERICEKFGIEDPNMIEEIWVELYF